MTSKKVVAAVCAAALSAPIVAVASRAAASPRQQRADRFHVAKVISDNYIGPLQFAVRHGSVFVADSFMATLTRAGHKAVIAKGPSPKKGGDLSGVTAVSGGRIAYTTSNGDHSNTRFNLLKNGKLIFSYNLAKFEKTNNPDHATTYGAVNPTQCQSNALKKDKIPVSYQGGKDSHPYSVAHLGGHRWVVGDAGGNDLIVINDHTGTARVLAVMPAITLTVTKSVKQALGLPKCTLGLKYRTESVPTDVERGAGGAVIVSTLAGGQEIPGAPALGRVYAVGSSGLISLLGKHFDGATNVAVTNSGQVYVAELDKGRLSQLVNGRPQPVFHMTGLVAVEWRAGSLFVSAAPAAVGAHAKGEVVRLAPTT